MNGELKLLVEWSSPWREFVSSIRPALGRSPKQLAGEARTSIFPYKGMLLSWILEAALLAAAVTIPAKLASMRPSLPAAMPKYDVIYFSGDELPQIEDASGAQTGRSGRAGGREAHHRTQTIRVARGSLLRERVVDAPDLKLPSSNLAVANLLAYKPVPGPPPAEGLRSSRSVQALPQAAVPPAPEVIQAASQHPTPALSPNVVPPPPSLTQRILSALHLPGSNAVQVVPPPVSAPEQMTTSNPRLMLPAPTPIAPPPQISREISPQGPGYGASELRPQVIPPPASLANSSLQRQPISGLGTAAVVPPPVQLGNASLSHTQKTVLGNNAANVAAVPPPVQMGNTSLSRSSNARLGNNVAVIPPPPSISGEDTIAGSGRGNRGTGFGGAGDIGDLAAPPKNVGSSGGKGIVVSSQPGPNIGRPGSGGTGALAMSPTGGASPGMGGSGGGTSIGHGSGPGSGFTGEGTGAAKAGTGRGSDLTAHAGISPYPGPGGAGTGTTGTPPMPGVSVRGGNNVVTLPSFGPGSDAPATPGRSPKQSDPRGLDITVVASSRSGGAFNFYGALKGDKVYTIYIDTSLGPAVMQFADPTSAAHPYADDLIAPQPMRADLPAGLPRARLVIACILDRSGSVRNPQVLEPASALMTSKVLAALNSWKFQPALRGTQPVEVNAILGFNIDTNDRN